MRETEGERVRRLLAALGYLQTEAAELMGGVQGTVSDWTGKNRLTTSARIRLAKLTADPDAATAWLAEGAGKEMPASIAKRAVSVSSDRGPTSGAGSSSDPRLGRAIAGLEMVLRELREVTAAPAADVVAETLREVQATQAVPPVRDSQPRGPDRRAGGDG